MCWWLTQTAWPKLRIRREEWGNRRLLETVQANCERNARDVVSQVMTEADGFAAGAPQFDDMTLWVARVASARLTA
jgi:serine phosphatase RsbU (regulator of sigma subunit)